MALGEYSVGFRNTWDYTSIFLYSYERMTGILRKDMKQLKESKNQSNPNIHL